jgi:hypothetical protein
MIQPAVRAEAQRILDGAARRLLDERSAGLDGDPLRATAGSDESALENGADKRATLIEVEQVPVRVRVDDKGGGVDAL